MTTDQYRDEHSGDELRERHQEHMARDYERRDDIRDSRAKLLAEHKEALARWQAERATLIAEIEKAHMALNAWASAGLFGLVWRWLLARLPINGRAHE